MTTALIDILFKAFFTLILGGGLYIITKYVRPWLAQHNLTEAATIAVQAAQAIIGRYNGQQKLKEALNQMKQKGYDIDADEVINAVKAAWYELNQEQIASGEKESTVG